MLGYDSFFVGGQWRSPAGAGQVEVISPATEQPIASFPAATEADIDAAVAAARQAFDTGPWPRMTLDERIAVVSRIAPLLQPLIPDLARLQVDEMGSPIAQMRPLTEMVIGLLDYVVIQPARAISWAEARRGPFGESLVLREPVGVVAAITPWNTPLLFLLFKMLPAVVAGCCVIIKPAPESPLDAYAVAAELGQAGFPDGVISIIPADRQIGEYLVSHPGVDKVSFTGSTAAGQRVGAICGANVTRVTMELGGKSAAIVLDDADFGSGMPALLNGALQNNGQVCSAITRFLIPRSRYAEFADAFCAAVAAMTVGDPHEVTTGIGPLVAERQRDRVMSYIESGLADGAELLVGGCRPAHLPTGWYVEPTVFGHVTNDMRIAREEIFGPVVSLIPYDGEEEAVRMANDSPYGLSGAVFTSDYDRGLAIARQIRTGTFSIDGFKADLSVPFGGYKSSGIGREYGPEGMSGFLEYKSVHLPSGFSSATG